jgi:ribonucleoside-diphosphate reductase alpha chain
MMEVKKQEKILKKSSSKGLRIARFFTDDSRSAFDYFQYETRRSQIKGAGGEVVFEMENVEVPASWSQVATDVLAQKYLRREGVPQPDGSKGPETSVKQVVHRMVSCWKNWGVKHNYFSSEEDAQIFYDELVYMLLKQIAAPNSPQWFNTGLYDSYGIKGKSQGHYYVDPATRDLKMSSSAYERPQPHACFILSIKDDLVNEGGIMDHWVKEARIFKYGSGVGTNYSAVRGVNERLSGGGKSSGLMSFLKIGDRAAGAIKSGGTTRRAAKMVCLDLDHPEIEEFVKWKAEEEKKAAVLIAAGYSADYEGEAYQTIAGQNSNNSVRVPDAFMETMEKDGLWELKNRKNGKVCKQIPAKKLWETIAESAWSCADPGVQFDTTINQWHTCPEDGKINASNPCSEYMFLDDTACNLASLNLLKFYDAGEDKFDIKAFEHASRLWTTVLEISVQMAQFPTKHIARLSDDYRTLGLGYANLGTLLMVMGLPYDSERGRSTAAALTGIMTGTAYKTSAEMASVLGAFNKYPFNKKHMMRVVRNHRRALHYDDNNFEGLNIKPQQIEPANCPTDLLKAAQRIWNEAVEMGEKYGFRNAQVSAIAPTGTIGLLMDCDTTGIEPDFALVKFKKLSGGGYFRIVNQSVTAALKKLGYEEKQIRKIVEYAKGTGSFNGAPYINHETLSAKGFTKKDLEKLDKAAKSAFDIEFIFNVYTLGKELFKHLGIAEEVYMSPGFNFLKSLGFTETQIRESNDYVCGKMTLEGAPFLKDEHLPVFDCANKCGLYGKRFIHPHGHIRMMAAVQPFITGAISKTINLPHESSVKEVQECYNLSWKTGLKSVALYRDGSKMSQPLSISKDKTAVINNGEITAEQVLETARKIIQNSTDTNFKRELSRIVQRKKLPSKRNGFTQKAKIGGQTIFVRTGEYEDGTLGEIFIDMHKEGASFRSLLNCFSIAVSIGLQYGVPLEEFSEKFVFTRFDPSGPVDHPNIKSSTSVVDYIFRLLAFEYLQRDDLVQVKNKVEVKPEEIEHEKKVLASSDATQQYLSHMSGDAPLCPTCGHITVRSGACYKCINCGTSLGCS